MRAGILRHKFEIEKPVYKQTTSGDNQIEWYYYATRHGSLEYQSGNENLEQKQITATSNYLITIRYCKGIDQTFRLKYKKRYFSIISIENVNGLNREMKIRATELNV